MRNKWSKATIFIVLGIVVLSTGLLPQIDIRLVKYTPLGLIATGFILAFFRQQLCMNSDDQNSNAIADYLRTLNFKPQSLLFCGVSFIVLGILLLIKTIGQWFKHQGRTTINLSTCNSSHNLANGNRLTEVIDTHTQTYSYDTNSHHLLETQNGGTTDYSYDANGNTTNNTDHDFIYGDNNRLKEAQILNTPVATYVYNGKGERVKKEGSETTLYYYDQSGLLIAELDAQGNPQREYIYLDGVPLAMVSAASTPNPDPEEQILDNDTASFTGDWPTSTSVSV